MFSSANVDALLKGVASACADVDLERGILAQQAQGLRGPGRHGPSVRAPATSRSALSSTEGTNFVNDQLGLMYVMHDHGLALQQKHDDSTMCRAVQLF